MIMPGGQTRTPPKLWPLEAEPGGAVSLMKLGLLVLGAGVLKSGLGVVGARLGVVPANGAPLPMPEEIPGVAPKNGAGVVIGGRALFGTAGSPVPPRRLLLAAPGDVLPMAPVDCPKPGVARTRSRMPVAYVLRMRKLLCYEGVARETTQDAYRPRAQGH
jgi:hypothetical protein